MTEKEILQLICGKMVVASKLTKEAKLQMLEYVQHQASESQLKLLLLDGKIAKLDEQTEAIVNDRFKISNFQALLDKRK